MRRRTSSGSTEMWSTGAGFKFREGKISDPIEKQVVPGISDFSEFLLIFQLFLFLFIFL
jgi:hypothetical protein